MAQCKSCGAEYHDEKTCEEAFHTLLFWELDYQLWDVHHLLVLCYHLQHPHLYSREALEGAKVILERALIEGVSPQTIRKQMSASVDSGTRKFKITATDTSQGYYAKSIQWRMTVADVIEAGMESYYESVRQWAKCVYEDLT